MSVIDGLYDSFVAIQRWLVIGFAFFLLVVPSSSANVILHSCVGGVALWNTRDEVLREKGPPLRKVRRNSYDIFWHYRTMTVFFSAYDYSTKPPSGFVVISVASTNRNERTSLGIGVGSSESAAKRAYPNLRCASFDRTRRCEIRGRDRSYSTSFEITKQRVSEIAVEIDSGFDDGPRQKPDPRC